jgi:outer membrane protein assembly factor BamB
VVYVAGDEGVNVNPSTAHEVVQALAARDGSRRWTFTVRTGLPPGVIGVASANPPGLAAGPGYVYAMIDRLYCLQADNGATVWSAESPYTVNLAAGPGVVYAVQVTLFALASRDGTQLWSVDVNADVMPALVLAGGVIYMLGYGPQGNAVAAIRASDGARLWATPPPRGGWWPATGRRSAPCPASAHTFTSRENPRCRRPRCGPTGPTTARCCTGRQLTPGTARNQP